MNKAVPCRRCQTDRCLRWKYYSETGEIWIACDGCGAIGPVGASHREAGEAWNAKQEGGGGG